MCNFFGPVKLIKDNGYCSIHYPQQKNIFPRARVKANKNLKELDDLREIISVTVPPQ